MNTRNTLRTTVLATAIVTACSWAIAQDITLYDSHTLPDAVVFEPKNTTGMSTKIDMIVKGPEGFYLRKSFEAGEPIEFNPAAVADQGLPDGTYRYELRVMGISGVTADRDSGKPAITESLQGGFGAFSIKNGQIISPDAEEAPYKGADAGVSIQRTTAQSPSAEKEDGTRDQVIADDLIVTGSLCVGFDCVNGETFGFDTIRMKENNTRIKFEDTSTTGSFPSTDWQLTANDSANGGQNKFSIDDITNSRIPFTVEGASPSNSLYVDSTGNIGMGTSTPVLQAHIADGNTPGLRLEQDGSSGFQPQTWDLAGNETNFFIRDVTSGSRLPFRIRPGAPTSSIDIAASGNVGIGTTSPSSSLHVRGTSGSTAAQIEEASGTVADRTLLTMANNGGSRIIFDDNSASANDWVISTTGSDMFRVSKVGSGGTEFELDGAGNLTITGTLTTASNVYPDYVFKENYKLMPIREVEAFILENGHLPNVRSADEIIRDGLDLTEGHVKLMEKVEELTLYTIEQQNLIDELRARLDELEDS